MDFPSNANKDKDPTAKKVEKAPEKKIEKIVSGEVVQRKKSLGRRFKDVFLGGEFNSATRYIAAEVLLPALRNMVVDATTKGVERMIYGDSNVARRSSGGSRPRVSYQTPVDRGYARPSPRANLPDQSRRNQSADIILSSREEAELVLERLGDIIETYDVASVADLHDMVGLPSTFVDNNWGWSSLQYARVVQIREGFLLDLPPVEPLK